MIWNGVIGPLDPPPPEPAPMLSQESRLFNPERYKLELALLKSISTGVFIDVQFYAYNAVCDNVPVDLRPLFTSSIVIEEWVPTIETRKFGFVRILCRPVLTFREETVGVDSQAACLMDGLLDDYECWDSGCLGSPGKDRTALYVPGSCGLQVERSHVLFRQYRTEAAATTGNREAVVLTSGAWRT